ncbi:MAG: hypothetical protein IT536_16265 [Hyphomicrobiales bacterium]|nr:hypothetical protein [Hyphomicrobiales bacterium]
MAAILPFLRDAAFEPDDIQPMSMAFEDVCKSLNLTDEMSHEVMAVRIIELARRGERSPTALRDRVLREAGLASSVEPTQKAG